MPYTTITGYLSYSFTTLKSKPLILIMSTIIGFFITMIMSAFQSLAALLVVNVTFLLIYVGLAFVDWISGIIASRVEKQPFKSFKFLKKIFLIGFSLLIIFVPQALIITFNAYPASTTTLLQAVLSVLSFALECVKIGLILTLIIYELTSLRENFIRLKLLNFIKIVDVVLVPINKLNDYVVRKFDKVIDDDVVKQT